MKLPWKKKIEEKEDEIERLEEQIESLEQDRDSWKERFKAEEERKKELSRKKQEAEEELKLLKQRLETENKQVEEEEEKEELEADKAGFRQVYRLLKKLQTVESPEKDLVTVYSVEDIRETDDLQGLKNAVTGEQFEELEDREGFVAFLDKDFGNILIELVPFYSSGFDVGKSFDTDNFLDFIESGKYWALVSAGDTRIYREEAGDYEEVERVSSRVDRQHGKGGFSQGRFERKRDEQIDNHLKEVERKLEELEGEIYLLGDERFCKDLPGEYLGGFDPNRQKPGQFYNFRMLKV